MKKQQIFFLIILSGNVFGVKSISYPLGPEISVSGAFMNFTRLILPCSKHPRKNNTRKKDRGKSSTTVLKASRQKHSS